MRHLNAVLGIILLGLMLLLPSISAWTSSEFIRDEIKSLDKLTNFGTYEIKESAWYDPLKIFTEETVKSIELKTNTEQCIDCLSEGTIVLNKDGTLIDDLIWKRSFDDGKTFVDWKDYTNWKLLVEEDVDVFETQCIDLKSIYDEKNDTYYTPQECSQVKTGTTKQWNNLDFKKEYKAGTYNYKIEGSKKASVTYDWIIKTNGQLLESWAVWGAVIGVGGVEASITINSPANNSIQYTNLVTTNATANVTGGAYLTNASLNLSVNGGAWGIRNTTDLYTIGDGGLVSYYKLDETSGTTAFDSMGINNGTNNGATVNQAGKIETAYYFAGGTNSIVTLGTEVTPTSISLWVNRTGTGQQFLFNADNLAKGIEYNEGGDGLIAFYDTTHSKVTGATIDANVWTNLVFVHNGTGYAVYKNGAYVANSPAVSAIPIKTFSRTANSIGWQGRMDEIGFWNRSLTQSEITTLYNSGAGSRPTDTATTNTTTIFTNTFNAGDVVDFNYEFCDTDGDCGKSETRRFTIPFYEASRTYNETSYETKNETFIINISNSQVLTNVYLNYNGVDYLTTKNGDLYSKTLPMELVNTDTNRTFYYKFDYAGNNITSTSSIQLVKTYLVNWTGTKQYVNITIKDEYDNTIINSTTMDTLFEYYIDNGGYTNIHQEIKVEDGVFGLSSTPNVLKWSSFGRLYYYATGYQPRYFFLDNEEFTNSSVTQKTLYLLLQSDGILARYKIYDSIGNELENARITAYKIVGSNQILVEQVLTDSLGEASLFLNPNYYHRIVITYDACTPIDRTRRITSSDTYTEFMSCAGSGSGSDMNLTTFENVTSSFLPSQSIQYTKDTVTFSFTSLDSNCNLDETRYVLKHGGVNLINLVGNNPCGETLSQAVNLQNYSGTLFGTGIVKIGSSQVTLTKQYTVLNIDNTSYNQTSVSDLLDKIKDSTFGLELGLTPMTKTFICFLILFGLLASFGNLTSKDNIPIVLSLVTIFVGICSYLNFMNIFNSPYTWINQYGIALLVTLFSGSVIIRRYM